MAARPTDHAVAGRPHATYAKTPVPPPLATVARARDLDSRPIPTGHTVAATEAAPNLRARERSDDSRLWVSFRREMWRVRNIVTIGCGFCVGDVC